MRDAQQLWDTIPSDFRYDATCWDRLTPSACLVTHAIYLEYVYSVFQIQRILRRENARVVTDLIDVSMQMLSAVIDLTRQKGHREEIQERFSHVFLFYGLPSAGVLAYELRDYTLAGQPLPTSTPRSKIIRSLGSLVSWFEDTAVPSSQECGVCVVTTKVISLLLDETLNHNPEVDHRPDSSQGPHPISRGYDQAPDERGQLNSFSISGIDELAGCETSEEFLSWLDSLDWGSPFPSLEFGLPDPV